MLDKNVQQRSIPVNEFLVRLPTPPFPWLT